MQSAARAAEVRKMKLIKESNSAKAEELKANDRSIVKSIRNTMIIGLPLTTVMSGVLAVGFAIALDGCSSKEKQPVQTSSSYSQSTQPMVALAQPTPVVSPTPEVVAKKKPVVRKPSTVIFADKKNGISFRYPGKFTLVTGEKAKNDAALEEPLPMNFVQPGGVNVTSLALPGGATSSMFDVRINKNLTADECGKFAEPGVSDVGSNLPMDSTDGLAPSTLSFNGMDFTRAENVTERTDARYYHHFEANVPKEGVSKDGDSKAESKSGVCYEFALAVEDSLDSTKAVDHVNPLEKLERILSTVKIKPETAPAVTASVPAQPVSGTNPQ
jgi:hypothetical protein